MLFTRLGLSFFAKIYLTIRYRSGVGVTFRGDNSSIVSASSVTALLDLFGLPIV